jgi:hypothetical protein
MLLFLSEQFMKNHSCPKRRFFPEWCREVSAIEAGFSEQTGTKYSPSKLELLKKVRKSEVVEDKESWSHESVSNAGERLKYIKTRDDIMDLLDDHFSSITDEYIFVFLHLIFHS